MARSRVEMRHRLEQADRAIAALRVTFGLEEFLRPICAALTDHQLMLNGLDRDAARTLAGAAGDGR